MPAVYSNKAPPSPPESDSEAVVEVYALQAGHLTLPERFFVDPASETARKTVPSLSFLIVHHDAETSQTTRIVFDLGLRRDPTRYMEPIQKHIDTRQPCSTLPDVTESLAAGGLSPEDIDYVVYSHVHWDHVGEPRDFPKSTFVVGNGAPALLQGTGSLRGSHSYFEVDLLPADRTIQLSSPYEEVDEEAKRLHDSTNGPDFQQEWKPYRNLPRVLDLFHDGSLYVVDAPGHLPGHINLLARTGPVSSVYLAGDACHDRRIMRKERAIGEWLDDHGHICCIHADKKLAEQTIERIQELESNGVEVIFAHDVEWEENVENQSRFFGQSRT
ncbi:hypothetical protein LTR99_005641 [Exophiala xenobiotica]|uniref:Metallo-beta-lactamase domain-containing protein n=1 Tax=Vermiconidia calcicola TaxID=1690605 RepID=A0AAV9QGF3_9PEZI|nr:hypothetical protein H2202_000481 [Exophiala xenobiotica]KAK5540267.1 hypothetical protein LTR23_006364 [Chaetothyriales sp. CCFEE 6169]KAK5541285.1 hypothetical protein LTR25_003062 [Vermiconidia calcicola]KAK5194128.1 hypothetical protein LTR92_006468 [Exophiala xenobiotica]KAK5233659.1 hypothetical protein LTR47_005282 [Exophiala xenobiotica]